MGIGSRPSQRSRCAASASHWYAILMQIGSTVVMRGRASKAVGETTKREICPKNTMNRHFTFFGAPYRPPYLFFFFFLCAFASRLMNNVMESISTWITKWGESGKIIATCQSCWHERTCFCIAFNASKWPKYERFDNSPSLLPLWPWWKRRKELSLEALWVVAIALIYAINFHQKPKITAL